MTTVKPIDSIQYLIIGVQGENAASAVKMDITAWVEAYPDASFHILFKRYNEIHPYPVVTELENNIMTWYPSATDTAIPGIGYAEVRAVDRDTGLVKKSRIIPTTVENSVSGLDSDYIPEPFEEWANMVLARSQDVETMRNDLLDEQRDFQKQKMQAIAAILMLKDAMVAAGYDYDAEDEGLIMATSPDIGDTGTIAELIQELRDDMAALEQQVDSSIGDISDLRNNVANIEASDQSQDDAIALIQGKNSDQDSQLITMGTNLTSMGTNVSALQTDVTTAKSNITSLQTNMSAAGTNITALQTSVSTLSNSVSAKKSNKNIQHGRINVHFDAYEEGVSSPSPVNKQVTFSTQMDGAPHVICKVVFKDTLVWSSTRIHYTEAYCYASAPAKTGFTVTVTPGSGNWAQALDCYVDWIAVY